MNENTASMIGGHVPESWPVENATVRAPEPLGETVKDLVTRQKAVLDEIEDRTNILRLQVLGGNSPGEKPGARNVDCLASALEDQLDQTRRIMDMLNLLCAKMG